MILRIVSVLLISAVMFKPMMGFYLVMDYQLNKDYISKYLCENKDRPELECEGKCYLMQKLKKNASESQEHKTKQINQISKIEIMDIAQPMKVSFSNMFVLKIDLLIKLILQKGFFCSIFHPPIA